jgi:peptidoglycan DL-endopeptidase CwlO
MPHLTLPSFPRPRFTRRSSGLIVVGLLVVSLGTAVTAEMRDGVASAHPSGTAPQIGPTAAPVATATTKPVKLSTKPKHLANSTLLVTQRTALTHHQLRQLRHINGVRRTQTITAGHASIDGHHAFVVGANPQTFRPWTPKPTADSNALWASVSRGDLTASFDMGHNAKLPLGKDVPVSGQRGVTPIRVGAFASVGMAGVDAVVSEDRARQIGLTPRSGVLVSAPKADPLVVRKAVLHVFGKHANAELLKEVVVTRDAGEFLTRTQISGFLNAAASRVGAPYVWGATGPNSFDCSGLVQWSFARVGIRMPRVAQEQFFTGPHVDYKDARPGDLLFWHYDPTDPTFVDHVAIYVGNGNMIEAPHTGDVVKLVPVPLSNLAGVVRVDPALASRIA